ncbi:MAG: hypothetical protein QW594_02575 [Candidatus Woesearchaeota archaeon]
MVSLPFATSLGNQLLQDMHTTTLPLELLIQEAHTLLVSVENNLLKRECQAFLGLSENQYYAFIRAGLLELAEEKKGSHPYITKESINALLAYAAQLVPVSVFYQHLDDADSNVRKATLVKQSCLSQPSGRQETSFDLETNLSTALLPSQQPCLTKKTFYLGRRYFDKLYHQFYVSLPGIKSRFLMLADAVRIAAELHLRREKIEEWKTLEDLAKESGIHKSGDALQWRYRQMILNGELVVEQVVLRPAAGEGKPALKGFTGSVYKIPPNIYNKVLSIEKKRMLLLDQGYTLNDIAKMYHLSRSAVCRRITIAERLGLVRKIYLPYEQFHYIIKKKDAERLFQGYPTTRDFLYSHSHLVSNYQGYTYADIAQQLGMHKDVIMRKGKKLRELGFVHPRILKNPLTNIPQYYFSESDLPYFALPFSTLLSQEKNNSHKSSDQNLVKAIGKANLFSMVLQAKTDSAAFTQLYTLYKPYLRFQPNLFSSHEEQYYMQLSFYETLLVMNHEDDLLHLIPLVAAYYQKLFNDEKIKSHHKKNMWLVSS